MAAKLDPIQAAHLVIITIDAWLKAAGAGSFKADKTIPGIPPKGYAMSAQRYLKFCADISQALSANTGRKLTLNKEFRDAQLAAPRVRNDDGAPLPVLTRLRKWKLCSSRAINAVFRQ